MITRHIAFFSIALALVACGGKKPPETAAGTTTSAPDTTKPVETTTPDMPAPPVDPSKPIDTAKPAAETAKAAPEPVVAPTPAKASIAGKSISSVTLDEIQTAAKKLGWTVPASTAIGGMDSKGRESRTIPLKKGAATAEITIVRAVPGKGAEKDSNLSDAKTVADSHKDSKDDALVVDGDVLVMVTIKGKKADAQKLLDGLVKK